MVQRVHQTGEAKTLPHSTVEATADAIVAEGRRDGGSSSAAHGEPRQFGADPNSLCGSPRVFQVWTRRAAQIEHSTSD